VPLFCSGSNGITSKESGIHHNLLYRLWSGAMTAVGGWTEERQDSFGRW